MKKRSDAKSNAERPEVCLLLDENLASQSIIEGLRERGIPVMPSYDLVKKGAADIEILAALAGRPDLLLLSRDADFRYHPATRDRVIRAGVGAFVITSSGNKKSAEIVEIIAKAWRRIHKFARKNKRPFVARINSSGAVELHR